MALNGSGIFSISSLGRISPSPQWRMARHRHEFPQLVVVMEGKMKVLSDGSVLEAEAGSLLMYPAGEWHEEISDPKSPVETIYFNLKGPCAGRVRESYDKRGRMRLLARWVWEETSAGSERTPDPAFARLLALEWRANDQDLKEGDPVERAWNHMALHLEKDLTLDILAAQAHWSRYHFCREFKKRYGFSPLQELKRLRLKAAHGWISTTRLPLKMIATQTGFANESHLSREYKKHFKRNASERRPEKEKGRRREI